MHGRLFTSDFLREGIRETAGWNAAEAPFIDFRKRIVEIFAAVAAASNLNEAQSEDDVIVPVLKALGWDDYTRQQTANRTGREDVPDFLLFPLRRREAQGHGRASARPPLPLRQTDRRSQALGPSAGSRRRHRPS